MPSTQQGPDRRSGSSHPSFPSTRDAGNVASAFGSSASATRGSGQQSRHLERLGKQYWARRLPDRRHVTSATRPSVRATTPRPSRDPEHSARAARYAGRIKHLGAGVAEGPRGRVGFPIERRPRPRPTSEPAREAGPGSAASRCRHARLTSAPAYLLPSHATSPTAAPGRSANQQGARRSPARRSRRAVRPRTSTSCSRLPATAAVTSASPSTVAPRGPSTSRSSVCITVASFASELGAHDQPALLARDERLLVHARLRIFVAVCANRPPARSRTASRRLAVALLVDERHDASEAGARPPDLDREGGDLEAV